MKLTKKKGWALVGVLVPAAAAFSQTGPWYAAAALGVAAGVIALALTQVRPGRPSGRERGR